MCEIQFVYNEKGLTSDEKQMFFRMLENGSVGNRDAWGVYTIIDGKDYIHKNKGTPLIDAEYRDVKGKIISHNVKFLLGHNRLKTQGSLDNMNNHPFVGDRFAVVHNGSINNCSLIKKSEQLKYDETVDSYVILALLEKYKDTYESTEDLIKYVAETISGMFSIMIYDKLNDEFWYFKETSTTMSSYLMGETIVMSTNEASIELPQINGWFEPSAISGKPKPEKIYRIKDGKITLIETFTESYGHYDYTTTNSKKNEREDYIMNYLISDLEENFGVTGVNRKPEKTSIFVRNDVDEHHIRNILKEYEYDYYWNIKRKRKTYQIELYPILYVDDEKDEEWETEQSVKYLFD
jgi:glucosamine 6-phosphate synthetase-like amidotransferase/phosphosugar isomerase protein